MRFLQARSLLLLTALLPICIVLLGLGTSSGQDPAPGASLPSPRGEASGTPRNLQELLRGEIGRPCLVRADERGTRLTLGVFYEREKYTIDGVGDDFVQVSSDKVIKYVPFTAITELWVNKRLSKEETDGK